MAGDYIDRYIDILVNGDTKAYKMLPLINYFTKDYRSYGSDASAYMNQGAQNTIYFKNSVRQNGITDSDRNMLRGFYNDYINTDYGKSVYNTWDTEAQNAAMQKQIEEQQKKQAELQAQQAAQLKAQQEAAQKAAAAQAAALAKQKQQAQEAAEKEAAGAINRNWGNSQADTFSDAAKAIYGNQTNKKKRVGFESTDVTHGSADKLGASDVVRPQLLGM